MHLLPYKNDKINIVLIMASPTRNLLKDSHNPQNGGTSFEYNLMYMYIIRI